MSNVLDGKQMVNKEVFHDLVIKEFNLPSYYGRNLDSLWDLLSERSDFDLLITNADKIEQNLGQYGKSVLQLFDDLNNLDGFKVNYIFAGCFVKDLDYQPKTSPSNEKNNNATILNYKNKSPKVESGVYLADGARIIGDVEIGEGSSVWFNAVLRADANVIKIGKNSNIQDNVVIHQSEDSKVIIGDYVSIGHSVIVHGAVIEDNVLVGMGSTIMDNTVVGKNTIIGANSLITKDKYIPEGSLVMGSPAKVIRQLTEEEIESIHKNAEDYTELSKKYIVK